MQPELEHFQNFVNYRIGHVNFLTMTLEFFPFFQDELRRFCPPHISWNELQVQEFIGAGGFGKVFRGYYRGLEVAVKAARRDPNDDPEETKNKEI